MLFGVFCLNRGKVIYFKLMNLPPPKKNPVEGSYYISNKSSQILCSE